MQYDGTGYDTAEPLNHASYKMTVASLDYWLSTKGLPKNKAILGISLIKQKTQLAKERANGIMFWEFSHDSNTSNSLIKAANDQLGRGY